MGRYFANGLLTTLIIKKNKSGFIDRNFDLKKELDNILKDISSVIDVSLYEIIEENEEKCILSLKTSVVNDNIHELLQELFPLTRPNTYGFCDLKRTSDKEMIMNYSIKAERRLDKFSKKDEIYTIIVGSAENTEDFHYFPLYWLISDKRIYNNTTIYGATILLWIDCNKYCGEDEYNMLRVINELKTKYYQSKLSKALIYYITE